MKNGLWLLVVAALAFGAGYGVARTTVSRSEIEAVRAELAALEKRVDAGGRGQPARPARRRSGPDPDKIYDVDVAGAPSRGPADAKVTIVEFSDFQCPYCSRVGPTLDKVLEAYPKDVRVVYKHLPLSFHKNAESAAKASVAAGLQGHFWEMHDLLFENQRNLGGDVYAEFATKLELDVARFERDLASPAVEQTVDRDLAEAKRLGVSGTPGFFVNGRFMSGARPYESFKELVDEELEKAS